MIKMDVLEDKDYLPVSQNALLNVLLTKLNVPVSSFPQDLINMEKTFGDPEFYVSIPTPSTGSISFRSQDSNIL